MLECVQWGNSCLYFVVWLLDWTGLRLSEDEEIGWFVGSLVGRLVGWPVSWLAG